MDGNGISELLYDINYTSEKADLSLKKYDKAGKTHTTAAEYELSTYQ